MKRTPVHRQCGTAMVEFALAALLLISALVGTIEVGRALWTCNAAVDAVRLGARLAATCGQNAAGIKTRMTERLPGLTNAQIGLTYTNPGGAPNCTFANCRFVTVELPDYSHELLLLPAVSVVLPKFTTTLTREVMNSSTHTAECN